MHWTRKLWVLPVLIIIAISTGCGKKVDESTIPGRVKSTGVQTSLRQVDRTNEVVCVDNTAVMVTAMVVTNDRLIIPALVNGRTVKCDEYDAYIREKNGTH